MAPFSNLPVYDLPQPTPEHITGSLDSQYWVILSSDETNDLARMQLLDKILQSIQVDPSDTCRLTFENDAFYLCPILNQAHQKKNVISFGVHPNQLGMAINFTPYEIIALEGHHFLFSDLLAKIAGNDDKKRALWGALQKFIP
jgi:DNA polymerase III psi subunit